MSALAVFFPPSLFLRFRQKRARATRAPPARAEKNTCFPRILACSAMLEENDGDPSAIYAPSSPAERRKAIRQTGKTRRAARGTDLPERVVGRRAAAGQLDYRTRGEFNLRSKDDCGYGILVAAGGTIGAAVQWQQASDYIQFMQTIDNWAAATAKGSLSAGATRPYTLHYKLPNTKRAPTIYSLVPLTDLRHPMRLFLPLRTKTVRVFVTQVSGVVTVAGGMTRTGLLQIEIDTTRAPKDVADPRPFFAAVRTRRESLLLSGAEPLSNIALPPF